MFLHGNIWARIIGKRVSLSLRSTGTRKQALVSTELLQSCLSRLMVLHDFLRITLDTGYLFAEANEAWLFSTLRNFLAMSLGFPHWTDFKRFEMTTFGMPSVNDLKSWEKKHFHDHDLKWLVKLFRNYTVSRGKYEKVGSSVHRGSGQKTMSIFWVIQKETSW